MGSAGKGQYERLVDPPKNEADAGISSGSLGIGRGYMPYARNLDQFFSDVYYYHQSGGFWAVLLAEVLWTLKFVFIVFVFTELTVCTRWDILANSTVYVDEWGEVFIPPGRCWASLPFWSSLLVAVAFFSLLVQLIRAGLRLQRFWDIRQFCTYILQLPTTATGLGDLTWSEVQKRLIESQENPKLDELAVCHRILRHKNYLIAMVDQDILPIRFNLPVSEPPWSFVYLSDGYLFNLRLLLFWTPWSPFASHWQLRADYKEFTKRHVLSAHLTNMSRLLGLINLIFAPAILVIRALVFACANAERIRYQPGAAMGHRWSNYAHLYLRHYNELHHQFVVRLSLAYDSACKYLDCFISRNLISLAEAGAFILGSASIAFLIMGIVHEQMMHLPGYWAIVVVGGLLARACVCFIPDENAVYSPQNLMVSILAKIHRVRDHWIENASTYRVRSEFTQLFQYRMTGVIEELLSPILTPLLLILVVPNHTLEIVDFLRNYTVELRDLGDVCSFAQMDVRRFGDPQWRPSSVVEVKEEGQGGTSETPLEDVNQGIATGGKIELSLMHFHLNNPTCVLPPASQAYLQSIRSQLIKDMQQLSLQPSQDPNARPNSFQTGIIGPNSTACLFSSLYGGQPPTQSGFHRDPEAILRPFLPGASNRTNGLKNVSHLPGPAYINGDSMGFVGAMVESMRSSLHKSDPGMIRSAASDSTIQRGTSPHASLSSPVDEKGRKQLLSSSLDRDTGMVPSSDQPTGTPVDSAFLAFTRPPVVDPVGISMMAASAVLSVEAAVQPSYGPYVSQMENGPSQWGVGSSVFGASGSRFGLTDMLTADASASILYMHELAHRRRQQQSSSQRPLGRSYFGGSAEPYTLNAALGAASPYQPTYGSRSFINPGSSRFQSGTGSNERSSLTGVVSRVGYGATLSEGVGVVRATSDARRIQNQLVTEVAEEEDEVAGTPRGDLGSTAFRPVSIAHEPLASPRPVGSVAPVGVVNISGSPSLRNRPIGGQPNTEIMPNPDIIPPPLGEVTDTEHVWPDLPPTNC
ncbi:unnamed protein product [Calicophoron daubneyi]|uniref:Autophagy-related protein 9 n=1 Tax=Calicophoron daubneyi TaxID=300641 RepID=A0AAV2TNU9_CALDB